MQMNMRSASVRAPGAAQGARAAQRVVVVKASPSQVGKWKSMDAGNDTSDDQQDITRGKSMVDNLLQTARSLRLRLVSPGAKSARVILSRNPLPTCCCCGGVVAAARWPAAHQPPATALAAVAAAVLLLLLHRR